MKVFIVHIANYPNTRQVDSVWSTNEAAQTLAEKLKFKCDLVMVTEWEVDEL